MYFTRVPLLISISQDMLLSKNIRSFSFVFFLGLLSMVVFIVLIDTSWLLFCGQEMIKQVSKEIIDCSCNKKKKKKKNLLA